MISSNNLKWLIGYTVRQFVYSDVDSTSVLNERLKKLAREYGTTREEIQKVAGPIFRKAQSLHPLVKFLLSSLFY